MYCLRYNISAWPGARRAGRPRLDDPRRRIRTGGSRVARSRHDAHCAGDAARGMGTARGGGRGPQAGRRRFWEGRSGTGPPPDEAAVRFAGSMSSGMRATDADVQGAIGAADNAWVKKPRRWGPAPGQASCATAFPDPAASPVRGIVEGRLAGFPAGPQFSPGHAGRARRPHCLAAASVAPRRGTHPIHPPRRLRGTAWENPARRRRGRRAPRLMKK